MTLKFSFANQKLLKLAHYLGMSRQQVVSFDLPAGFSCPAADICRTFANRESGKLRRVGPVLCYAAKAECMYPNTRKMRWSNFQALIDCKKDLLGMITLIDESLPKKAKIVRIHSSGDFYSETYFQAWVVIAALHPEITFFAYTKIIAYAKSKVSDNFYLQYSFGGQDDKKWDATIPTCFIGVTENQYPGVRVVCADKERGYEDFVCIVTRESFVIPVH